MAETPLPSYADIVATGQMGRRMLARHLVYYVTWEGETLQVVFPVGAPYIRRPDTAPVLVQIQ